MARGINTLGGQSARGSVGGITTRGYRGMTIIHKKKRMPREVLSSRSISSDTEINGMLGKWNFEEHCVTRLDTGLLYIVSANDLIGGVGTVSQAVPANQPRFIVGGSLAGGHAYGEADGINDELSSVAMAIPRAMPFEVWMVANEGAIPATAGFQYGISATQARGLTKRSAPVGELQMRGSLNLVVGQRGFDIPKVWRCVWNGASSYLWINGLSAGAVGDIGTPQLQQMNIWGRMPAGGWSNFKLWRLVVFGRILTATEAILLTNYYRSFYAIP